MKITLQPRKNINDRAGAFSGRMWAILFAISTVAACATSRTNQFFQHIALQAEPLLPPGDACYIGTQEGNNRFIQFDDCLRKSIEIAGPTIINQRIGAGKAMNMYIGELQELTGSPCASRQGSTVVCDVYFSTRLESFFKTIPAIMTRTGPCQSGHIEFIVNQGPLGSAYIAQATLRNLQPC